MKLADILIPSKKNLLLSFIVFISLWKVNANDIELGRVKWSRDLLEARIQSKILKKDIFILFQEIPGCSTCKNYGKNVLSHPLIVEIIEDLFIPLAIHNNKTGKDREVLNLFGEPAWNNPVVRIVDQDLKDVVSRLSGNYSSYGLISTIIAALQVKNKKIDKYILLLEEEMLAQSIGTKTAYLGMYCFWSGEKCYAQAEGVVSTKAGFMNGSEVVEVQYNPQKTDLDEIIRHGKSQNCADKLFTNDLSIKSSAIIIKPQTLFKADKESKYYLYHSQYKSVPMTELQACYLNDLLSQNKSVDDYLSPRQIQFLKNLRLTNTLKQRSVIGIPIEESWYNN
ncbi:MAG: peptide-methionine (S)-S-oxide reductase [Saprospiraceae bacterium]|nr:peptide-methionine (S)-S-oxide reductase [Saprospiraceae bacterium]